MKVQQHITTTIAVFFIIFAASPFLIAQEALTAAKDIPLKSEEEQKQIAVLRSEAPLFDKAAACRKLAVIGTKEAVPVLAAFLSDESLGDYARLALEAIQDPSVDDCFREALGRCRGRMLIGVVNSIGVRRDVKAVSYLNKLAKDPSSGASAEALAALGRIATDQAIETVRQVMTAGPATLRPAAAEACLTSAEHLLAVNKRKEALELYDAVRKADVPVQARAAATYGVILASGSAGLPLLIEQLKSDDPAMVKVSLRAAREISGPEVTTKLAADMAGFNPGIQVLLIKVIAERKDPKAIEIVKVLAESKISEVRIESLKAMGQVGNVSSVPALLKVVNAGGDEAAAALISLRTINGDGVDEAIIESIKNAQNDEIAAELIEVLSDRNATVAVNTIFPKAQSPNIKVRSAAFTALGKLAGPEDIGRIVSLAGNLESDAGRNEVERAVVLVSGRIPDESKRADAVIKALEQENKIAVRCSFIRILGGIANDKAFEIIKSSMKDENEQIKDAAVRAITEWPNAEALDTLLEIFHNTDNKVHSVLALRGYVRILEQDKLIAREKKAGIYGELMEDVNTVAERKNILGGLASLQHPSSFAVLRKYLNDPQVGDEACLAAIQTAKAIISTQPDLAKTIALEVAEKASNQAVRDQVNNLIKTIEDSKDTATAPKVSDGQFHYLFDSKTFVGWEGDLGWFRIEDGAIVAGKLLGEKIPHNFFLATKKEYFNFELQVKVKTSAPRVNGGIQFRSRRRLNHFEVIGYQADLCKGIWGALYDESRRRKFLVPVSKEVQKTIKDNDWNDYKIRCVDNRIQLFVNGVQTVDYVETDPEIAKQSGIIAVQIHGGLPGEVWYKDIKIKEL